MAVNPAPRGNDPFYRSRNWWSVFVLSALLRVLFAFSPSYIHPDEHFQGPEAIASRTLGWATRSTWEFDSNAPARSYFSIWVVYGIPLYFIEALFDEASLDPLKVYYCLRALFAVASWILCDMAIDRFSVARHERIKNLLLLSTSYVTWTYQSHTLSNAVETPLLLWSLVIIYELKSSKKTIFSRNFDSFLLGIIIAFGIFNRPSFPAFLVLPSVYLFQHFVKHPTNLISFIVALGLTSLLAIIIDTHYYNSETYVLTPLNNLLYNMDKSNLSHHGIHSRFHHAFINLPELFGPGLLLLASERYLWTLPFLSIVSGLLFLSFIPHQEARFLLPLVPLLCCCADSRLFRPRVMRILLAIWLSFNIVMGVIMGIFHQGGVVPAQAHIGRYLSETPSVFVWWKTYSPPIWIMGKPLGTVDIACPNGDNYEEIYNAMNNLERHSVVIDLMGSSTEVVNDVLLNVQGKSHDIYFISSEASVYSDSSLWYFNDSIHESTPFKMEKVWRYNYHLSLDSIDFTDLQTLKPGIAIWKMAD